MEKEYIQKVFTETLEDNEKQLMTVASIICIEGLDIDVLYHLYNPDCPHALYNIADSLCIRNWLLREHKRICCDRNIANAILEIVPARESCLMNLLANIEEYLSIEPLDDYLSRQQYFVAARLLLGYIMEKWEDLTDKDLSFVMAFQTNVINFASNVELSFHKSNRQPVDCIEERLDYKLLVFTVKITGNKKLYELLGSLYSNIFRYDEALMCFYTSESSSLLDSKLLISLSEMYWNLSLAAQSFQHAYNAYLRNQMENNPDQNIYVCLYLSRLCGLYDIDESCKLWLQNGKKLIKKRRVPEIHPIRIMLYEIEALIAKDDSSTANDYLDKAELMSIKLYGSNSPTQSMISYIRYAIYTDIGMSRKDIETYRDYVDNNHFCYGFSPADTSILYSTIINSNNERGCYSTSAIYEARMLDLHSENITFAPGVRFYKELSEAANSMIDKDYDLCAFHIENARSIFLDEIKPDGELIDTIKPVFEGNVVPDIVTGKDYKRGLSCWNFEIELGRGEYSAAREHVQNEIVNEDNLEERMMLNIRLGRISIKEGNIEEGLKQWKEVIDQADASCKFEIIKEIAEWAVAYDLSYEALQFYTTALQAEYMIYAKTKDLAVALRNYADILKLYNKQEQSDESWQQAVDLLKAMSDRDGVALAYWYWASTKQDYQAENLLARAIKYWTRDGIFDETLSHMYREYALTLGMQGKMKEARTAAQQAVSLFPTNYPEHLEEELEDYL
mgnify:CR=1 FL=1